MYLDRLALTNYKNYEQAAFRFSPQFNAIVGENGAGKTNLLDAIYYLCFCKSYFNASDSNNIRHEQAFFRLDAQFSLSETQENIVAKVAKARKKEFLRNGVPYQKLSEHIGLLPAVMIAPNDTDLIKFGSDNRRKLLDTTLCQLDKIYLKQLIIYNKILQQRNALLKKFAETRRFNTTLLATYNQQLVPAAHYIVAQRKALTDNITDNLQAFYQIISGGKEEVACTYVSALLNNDFSALLTQNLKHDRQLQRTTQGTHRDDWQFTIKSYPLKKFGSQGQQKSFLIALKLAIYQYIQAKKQLSPILLLDDIFAKLDWNRLNQLIALICTHKFGQVFLSDTQHDRIKLVLSKHTQQYELFTIADGHLV